MIAKLPGWLIVSLALVLLVAGGCASKQTLNNAALERHQPESGYRLDLRGRDIGDVLVVLAFSGGGTRAAAFSYGVLEELRDTAIRSNGEDATLLSEIDAISSVSGGSFTSAYYGLFGEEIFERYEEEFLRADIEGVLLGKLFNPLRWPQLIFSDVSRSDLAIGLYDQTIFRGATFADLEKQHGPVISINSTDLSTGSQFPFSQDSFDFLCSDLSQLKIAQAVAASSAVPVAFSPIPLINRSGQCGFRPDFVPATKAGEKESSLLESKEAFASLLDSNKRPFMHLVDGGISDNLGLRTILTKVGMRGGIEAVNERLKGKLPRHILIILADARVSPKNVIDKTSEDPSLAQTIGAVSAAQISRYDMATIELTRRRLQEWAAVLASEGKPATTHFVHLRFDLLPASDQDFFNSIPTTFNLSDEQIRRLRQVSRKLLNESAEYQALLHELDVHAAGSF